MELGVSSQNVIQDPNVGIPQVFGRLYVILQAPEIGTNFGNGHGYSNLDIGPPFNILVSLFFGKDTNLIVLAIYPSLEYWQCPVQIHQPRRDLS